MARQGWEILVDELPRQVTADGVDFEASCAYHRLVTELFFLPALYRLRRDAAYPTGYRTRLAAMARFAARLHTDPTARRRSGATPTTRGRLPLGGQALNDHRYLAGAIGLALDDRRVLQLAAGPRSEALWLHGADAAAALPQRADARQRGSAAFAAEASTSCADGGDHVFVDCGPVGLAGRGGHGHNDCLALEAVLGGALVLVDRGSYVYTASPSWRNDFRSTGGAQHTASRRGGAEPDQ